MTIILFWFDDNCILLLLEQLYYFVFTTIKFFVCFYDNKFCYYCDNYILLFLQQLYIFVVFMTLIYFFVFIILFSSFF